MSVTKRRRLAQQILAELRALRSEVAHLRADLNQREGEDQAHGHRRWAAIYGAEVVRYAANVMAQREQIDDGIIDRAREEGAALADWASERERAQP